MTYADLIAYESFSYKSNTSLEGKKTNYGFKGRWTSENSKQSPVFERIKTLNLANFGLARAENNGHYIQSGMMKCGYIIDTNPVFEQTYFISSFISFGKIGDVKDAKGIIVLNFSDVHDKNLVSVNIKNSKVEMTLGDKVAISDANLSNDETYLMVAKLTVKSSPSVDQISLKFFRKGQEFNKQPDDWLLTCSNPVSGIINSLSYGINDSKGYLKIDELKIGTEWRDIVPDINVAKSLIKESTERYKTLSYTKEAIHVLHSGFGNVSILETGNNQKGIVITGRGKYIENPAAIYMPVDPQSKNANSLCSSDLQIYNSGEPFSLFESEGPYASVRNNNGLFDVIDYGALIYYKNTGTQSNPSYKNAGRVQVEEAINGTTYIGDIDGDNIPDFLIAVPENEYWKSYWPDGSDPWGAEDCNDMGPSDDYINVGAARGYDIEGNWLGKKVKTYFYWAKGYFDQQNKLGFGKKNPIYLGNGDYHAQWISWQSKVISIAPLKLNDRTYLIACGDVDNVLFMQILESKDGAIHLSKSKPLLKSGRLESTHNARIVFVGNLDQDKQTEIVLRAGADGTITVLKGTAAGEFIDCGNVCSTGGGLVSANTLVTPCRADWDEDGFCDLIVGDASGYMWFIPGTSDPLVYSSPVRFKANGKTVKRVPYPNKSLQGPQENKWGYLQPTVGDWDGDGHVEIITNDSSASLILYKRTEDITNLQEKEFTINGLPLPTAWRSRPAILPGGFGFAGDDRACLLYLDGQGELAIAVPSVKGGTEIEKSIKLKNENGGNIRLCGPHDGLWGRTKMAIADWDGDGVWDILFGTHGGSDKYFVSERTLENANMHWLRNIGTSSKPVFAQTRMIRHKNGMPIVAGAHNLSIWPTDLNNDGNLDIIAGEETGHILFFYREELAW
jgi:hypothetical protein